MKSSLTAKIDDYCIYVSRAVKYYKEADFPGSAINCRKAAEAACKVIIYNAYSQNLADSKLSGKSLKELIILLIHEGLSERKAINTLETLQIIGNKAAHDNPIGKEETIYAINALNLFNEYLFKEYLKMAPPNFLDFNIGETKETIIHKTEVIEKTIVQEKFNKETEEQLFNEIKKIHEKNEGDATRFEDLKKEIALSHQKIEELSRKKEPVETVPAPKKKLFTWTRVGIASVLLVILILVLYFVKTSVPEKKEEPLLVLNKHPDSVYVAINAFQIMQDNPNLSFKIEDRLLALIKNQRFGSGIPISILFTNYKGDGNPIDSILISQAYQAGFDLVYYGNLYETSLGDSNILEIRGCTTKPGIRSIREKKTKFKTLNDSTFIKEVNDQSNFPAIFYAEELHRGKSSPKLVKVLEGLRSYSVENRVAVLNALANAKTGINDYQGAMKDIDRIIQYGANSSNLTYKAILFGYLSMADSARTYYKRAYGMDSTGIQVLSNYAGFCALTGDMARAERLIQKWMTLYPGDYGPYYMLGNIRMNQGIYPEAKSLALKANNLNSEDLRNNMLLANLYGFVENKKDSAEYHFGRVLGKDSVNTEALTNLANYYQRYYGTEPVYKEKIDRLFDKIKQVKQQNDIATDYSLGLIAFERKDYKEAIKHLEKVVTMGGKEAGLFITMAQVYYNIKQPQKALEFSKKAVDLDSLNANNLTVRAYLLSYITPQDYNTCVYHFNKAMKANPPTFLDIYQQYGTYLSRQGKVKESIDLATRGYKLFPTDLRMNSLLAYGYFNLKNYQKAKPYFDFLVSQVPNDDTLMCDLSQCILMNFNGNKDQTFVYGAELINKALKISPNNPGYLVIYAMYFLRGGNPELASKFYLQAKEYSKNEAFNQELEELTYRKLTGQNKK